MRLSSQACAHPTLHDEVALRLEDLGAAVASQGSADYEVFSQVNLKIHRGEIVCLIGASGCGKSTLLMTIAGLMPRRNGRIETARCEVRGPCAQIGLVFQDAALLPWLTLRQNVALGLKVGTPRPARAETRRRVDEALQDVGMTHAQRLYPSQVSGGMAQRAALARTLARQPDVLLLDEPFGALDAVTRADMQQLLRQLVRSHRAAALLVTHDIDEALQVGDRVALMGRRPGEAATVQRWFEVGIDRAGSLADRDLLRRQVRGALADTMGRDYDI